MQEGSEPTVVFDVDGVFWIVPDSNGAAARLSWHREAQTHYNGDPELAMRIRSILTLGRHSCYFLSSHFDRSLRDVAPLYDLDTECQVPWINFPVALQGGQTSGGINSQRRAAIDEFLPDRPIVWVDDDIGNTDLGWAESRKQPTLLIKPDRNTGVTIGQLCHVEEWLGQH